MSLTEKIKSRARQIVQPPAPIPDAEEAAAFAAQAGWGALENTTSEAEARREGARALAASVRQRDEAWIKARRAETARFNTLDRIA